MQAVLSKLLNSILSFVILPLFEKAGAKLLEMYREWQARRAVKKEIEERYQEVKDAKTPEEIKEAHRNNTRI